VTRAGIGIVGLTDGDLVDNWSLEIGCHPMISSTRRYATLGVDARGFAGCTH